MNKKFKDLTEAEKEPLLLQVREAMKAIPGWVVPDSLTPLEVALREIGIALRDIKFSRRDKEENTNE